MNEVDALLAEMREACDEARRLMDKPPIAKVYRVKTDKPKPKTNKSKLYNYTHQKLSKKVRAERPICEVCNNALSEHANHLRYGDRLTTADYQSVCVSCHNRITHGKE